MRAFVPVVALGVLLGGCDFKIDDILGDDDSDEGEDEPKPKARPGDGHDDGPVRASKKKKKGEKGAPAPAPEPEPAGPVDPLAPPALAAARVEFAPPVPDPALDKGGMADHAYASGWSKDGAEFGYCTKSGMSGGTDCAFRKRDGKTEKLTDMGKAGPDARKTKEIDARLAERGYAVEAAEWAYGADLVIAWSVSGAGGKSALKVGARLRDGKDPAWAATLKRRADWYDIHPEAIALSPDGAFLGVVAHSFAGEGSDEFDVVVYDAAVLASRAYNLAGFTFHKRREWDKAATLFAKASAADPKFETAAYNLACALAQKHDVATEKALGRAIGIGGEKTKAKARKDHDFDAVRGEPWFAGATK